MKYILQGSKEPLYLLISTEKALAADTFYFALTRKTTGVVVKDWMNADLTKTVSEGVLRLALPLTEVETASFDGGDYVLSGKFKKNSDASVVHFVPFSIKVLVRGDKGFIFGN